MSYTKRKAYELVNAVLSNAGDEVLSIRRALEALDSGTTGELVEKLTHLVYSRIEGEIPDEFYHGSVAERIEIMRTDLKKLVASLNSQDFTGEAETTQAGLVSMSEVLNGLMYLGLHEQPWKDISDIKLPE